jgi:S1-C subfamily serine protease
MVPSNALQRTFRMQFGHNMATCFTIDIDGKQYIVTARHALPGIGKSVSIQLQQDRQWKDLNCNLVGIAPEEVDIVVLAPPRAISPSHPLEPTIKDMCLSQDAYFLGFPYGLQADVGGLNADFPLPLVKKACVSMFVLAPGKTKYLLLDGHNNPGFSGGPVIFSPPGFGQFLNVRVAGVVSGYNFVWEKVFNQGKETDSEIKYNTGIVIAYSIEYAVELIRANPIGALVSAPNA